MILPETVWVVLSGNPSCELARTTVAAPVSAAIESE